MEKLAYLLKRRFPALFSLLESAARVVVVLRFGRRLSKAEQVATLDGTVDGRPATIRILGSEDVEVLHAFLAAQPPAHVQYFQPHRFDRQGLSKVLGSRAFLNYGLFVERQIVGYALLKISPTGSAFVGLLVHPDFAGLGLGKFIVAYLYWQASLANLRTRSTISRANPASLRSHQAAADFKVIAELPNDYIMIEFPSVLKQPPELTLP